MPAKDALQVAHARGDPNGSAGHGVQRDDRSAAADPAPAEAEPLRAWRCDGCGLASFPPRDRCPACWSEVGEALDLPPVGTVHTFTTVHVAPPDQDPPYTVAYVDIGPVRLFARVEGEPRIGARGRVVRLPGDDAPATARYVIDLREDDLDG